MTRLGSWMYRYRWWVLLGWAILCAGLFTLIPVGDPAENERASFLPEDSDYRIAMTTLAEKFPTQCGLSTAVIIFERPDKPLTTDDLKHINSLPDTIKNTESQFAKLTQLEALHTSCPADLASLELANTATQLRAGAQRIGNALRQLLTAKKPKKTKKHISHLKNPMISPSGRAAIVRVNIPADFITLRSTRIVKHIRQILLNQPRPEGLKVTVTGTGGYGHDYAEFVTKSQSLTMQATLVAVVLILLLVYRAPLAALIPLLGISIGAAVVVKCLNFAQNEGFAIGTAEKIFVFVLMYGAGVDYTLLLVSRFREYLQTGRQVCDASAEALNATAPAIFASASTDAIGIFMLFFSQFLIFKTTGPVVAFALLVAMVAAITLVPALVSVCGKKLFWPLKPHRPASNHKKNWHERVWQAVGNWVTKRPWLVLLGTLAVLAAPAMQSNKIVWVYNALAGIEAEYNTNGSNGNTLGNAPAGVAMVRRHWPEGELAPAILLIEADKSIWPAQWKALSKKLQHDLLALKEIQNVRILTAPLGADVKFTGGSKIEDTIKSVAEGYYLSNDKDALRLEVIMAIDPMSNQAMALASKLKTLCRDAVTQQGLTAKVHLAGATAQMVDIRKVTQKDFTRLVILVLGVIFVIVLALLRDPLLTAWMVALIGLSYLTTLGLCSWSFAWLFDNPEGMDWKVQVFLFVVMAAVGVDYNIFLAARLRQEAKHHPPKEAIRRAMIFTGPVISSCGLIMAATLGSLMVGKIELLRQLGFALGLGMLMDTFVVRPLLLPSFATIFNRTGQKTK